MNDLHNSKRVLRIKELCNLIGLGRSTVYDYLNPESARYDPSFPQRIKLGVSAVGWFEGDVYKWLESRV